MRMVVSHHSKILVKNTIAVQISFNFTKLHLLTKARLCEQVILKDSYMSNSSQFSLNETTELNFDKIKVKDF